MSNEHSSLGGSSVVMLMCLYKEVWRQQNQGRKRSGLLAERAGTWLQAREERAPPSQAGLQLAFTADPGETETDLLFPAGSPASSPPGLSRPHISGSSRRGRLQGEGGAGLSGVRRQHAVGGHGDCRCHPTSPPCEDLGGFRVRMRSNEQRSGRRHNETELG